MGAPGKFRDVWMVPNVLHNKFKVATPAISTFAQHVETSRILIGIFCPIAWSAAKLSQSFSQVVPNSCVDLVGIGLGRGRQRAPGALSAMHPSFFSCAKWPSRTAPSRPRRLSGKPCRPRPCVHAGGVALQGAVARVATTDSWPGPVACVAGRARTVAPERCECDGLARPPSRLGRRFPRRRRRHRPAPRPRALGVPPRGRRCARGHPGAVGSVDGVVAPGAGRRPLGRSGVDRAERFGH